jgi:predicted Zn-dependent protease
MKRGVRYFFLRVRAVFLLVAGDRAGALRCFERMLQDRPGNRYALASLAHVQVQAGKPAAAVTSLYALTAAWPQHAAGWFNLGYVLQQVGRDAEAIPAFHRALALNPQLDRAWYGLAMALVQQKQWPAALHALRENTALQPMSPYGWYQLAHVHWALGEAGEAVKVIEHLRRFEPRVADQLERETRLVSPGACHAAC